VKIHYDDGSQEPRNSNPPNQKEVSTLEDLIAGCFIQTCSTMYRKEVFSEIPSWYIDDQSADWSLLILAAQHGKIGYIDEVMGVYRQHSRGYWTGLSKAEQLGRVIQFYEALRHHLPSQYIGRIETELARTRNDLAFEKERMDSETAVARPLGESKWSLRVAGNNAARMVRSPECPDVVRVAIEKAESESSFDIQLNLPRLEIRADHRYELRFKARADRARSLFVGVAQAHEPWSGLGMYRKIDLTSEWQGFDEVFLAAADESNARIHFDLGGSNIPVEISSLSLLGLHDGRSVLPDPEPVQAGSSQQDGASFMLRRVTPVSRDWGFDRGLPVDRYYIEDFLIRHSQDVRGRVLEIEDDSYTRRFGGDRVTVSDVLHVEEGNPRATVVGDLTCADHIPPDTFDCIILTQTLHLIYDTRAALRTLHRILKPGGVLLATFPGITRISHDEWAGSWFWGFTTASSRRLFEEVFPAPDVKVEARGNVLAAISFLHGLAAEEMSEEELNYSDPDYEVLITVRAAKSRACL
jgi:SAM-dependent methyltransferase